MLCSAINDATALVGAGVKPPVGWKFRDEVLEKDLTISTPQGYDWIVQDELQNTYDACKEEGCGCTL
jgi:hypothetical protein